MQRLCLEVNLELGTFQDMLARQRCNYPSYRWAKPAVGLLHPTQPCAKPVKPTATTARIYMLLQQHGFSIITKQSCRELSACKVCSPAQCTGYMPGVLPGMVHRRNPLGWAHTTLLSS